GIWERVRSKSRGGGKSRERSKSRVKTGVPIAAAGLGGAALAGLYEKNKASKEAKRDLIIEDETGRGRRRRSRSRSRSVPAPHADDRRHNDDRDLIAYGHEPIYPDDRRGYYSDEEPASYHRRHRGGSSAASSPDNRKRKGSQSRSRGGRHLAEAGAAAGVAAVAAHEIGKRNERKKGDRSRSRQRYDDDSYDGRYHDDRYQDDRYQDDRYQDERYRDSPGPYSPPPTATGYLPPQQNAGYPPQGTYPSSTYFPPPPTGDNVYAQNPTYPDPQQQQQQAAAYPPYNPAEYAQPGPQQPYPYAATRGAYGDSDANLGTPYANETYAGDNRYGAADEPAPPTPRDERRRGRDPPENVSAPNYGSVAAATVSDAGSERGRKAPRDAGTSVLSLTPQRDVSPVGDDNDVLTDAVNLTDGVNTPTSPRARSSSRVRFDLGANEMHSPESSRKKAATTEERVSDPETNGDRKRRHRHSKRKHRDRDRDRDREGDRESSLGLVRDKYDRPPSGSGADNDRNSDGTVDLPERFDEHGNRKQEGAGGGDALEQILGGLASRFLGGGGGGGGDDDRGSDRSARRRHRH
ncbi:hypothetical protein LTR37_005492, partial [Vermiconidia calcicola]